MWEDDSIIGEIYKLIGECTPKISPEYSAGTPDAGYPGEIRTEALPGRRIAFVYADGSRTEEIPVRASLKIRLLSPKDGMRALAALDNLCGRIGRVLRNVPAGETGDVPAGEGGEWKHRCGITGVKRNAGPSKLSERGGTAEYGLTMSFYVFRSAPEGLLRRRMYLNTGTSESPRWAPVGKGFTLFGETTEPELYVRRYIHESEYRRDVTGVKRGIRYLFEEECGEEAAELLRGAADSVDPVTVEVLSVSPYPVEDGGGKTFLAEKRPYAAAPSGTTPRGEDGALMYGGTLWDCGGPVNGVFVRDDLLFAPVLP